MGSIRSVLMRLLGRGRLVVALSPEAPSRPTSLRFRNVTASEEAGPYACPCCGFVTLPERGGYEICPVCFWEDDGQDDHDADEVRGGPNGLLSLAKARRNYRKVGASDERHGPHVRPPLPEEFPKQP